MNTNNDEKLLVAVFPSATGARAAISEMRDNGRSAKDIGVLSRDDDNETELKSFKELEGNKAGKGAATGAAAGVAGGAIWALGISAGLLPAIGPVVAGGILGAVLASGAAGGAAGGIVGGLIGLGVSDEEAAYYEDELTRGRTVVVVQGDHLGRAFQTAVKHQAEFHPERRQRFSHPPQTHRDAPAPR